MRRLAGSLSRQLALVVAIAIAPVLIALLVVAWLIKTTGDPAAPAWYVIATSLVTIAAMLALPETRGRAID